MEEYQPQKIEDIILDIHEMGQSLNSLEKSMFKRMDNVDKKWHPVNLLIILTRSNLLSMLGYVENHHNLVEPLDELFKGARQVLKDKTLRNERT
jgi:hypothetical protein